jgi:hypothetical protein
VTDCEVLHCHQATNPLGAHSQLLVVVLVCRQRVEQLCAKTCTTYPDKRHIHWRPTASPTSSASTWMLLMPLVNPTPTATPW